MDARGIEERAANAMPAEVVQVLGGWRLRAGADGRRRTNSVLPLGPAPGGGLEAALDLAEAFYRRRGQPARFQCSPAARPGELEGVLERRGYTVEAPTVVLVARTADLAAATGLGPASAGAPSLAPTPDGPFLEALAAIGAGGDVAARTAPLRRIGPAAAFAAATHCPGGPASAVGFAVAERGWLGVFQLATAEDRRGRGLGTAVLGALTAWGSSQGALRTYLQVEVGNERARAWYARLGMTAGYEYRYRTLGAAID